MFPTFVVLHYCVSFVMALAMAISDSKIILIIIIMIMRTLMLIIKHIIMIVPHDVRATRDPHALVTPSVPFTLPLTAVPAR